MEGRHVRQTTKRKQRIDPLESRGGKPFHAKLIPLNGAAGYCFYVRAFERNMADAHVEARSLLQSSVIKGGVPCGLAGGGHGELILFAHELAHLLGLQPGHDFALGAGGRIFFG